MPDEQIHDVASEVATAWAAVLIDIHEKRKPLSHTRSMLEQAGLEILHVHHDSFVLRYNDGSTMLASPVIRFAFLPPWVSVLAPEDVKPVFDAIEPALNRVAADTGEFPLTVPWICIDARKPDRD